MQLPIEITNDSGRLDTQAKRSNKKRKYSLFVIRINLCSIS